jgi:hypothetical protein
MKDLPGQAAQAMCDCPDSGLVAEAWQQTPEHCLEVCTSLPAAWAAWLRTRRMYLLPFAVPHLSDRKGSQLDPILYL